MTKLDDDVTRLAKIDVDVMKIRKKIDYDVIRVTKIDDHVNDIRFTKIDYDDIRFSRNS